MASGFTTHDPRFSQLLGPNPTLELLIEHNAYPFAHEAGVYFDDTKELFITSNQFSKTSSNQKKERGIQITKISLGSSPPTREEIPSHEIPMANGGVNYKDGILFCSQGGGPANLPSGLYHMSRHAPYPVTPILTSFYRRSYNSVNDVVVHPTDGSIWFTDPTYGYMQGFRSKPELPNQVYRFDPETKSVRAVADGFGMPNGICFGLGSEPKVVYVTDTARVVGDGGVDGSRPASM